MFRKFRNIVKVLLGHIWPDILLNHFMDGDFIDYVHRKKQGLFDRCDNVKTIALRGSAADYGFFATESNESYNLGLTSSDLHAVYHLYTMAARVAPNLRNVVVFFAPITPGLDLILTKEKYRYVSYNFFFGIPYQSTGKMSSVIEWRIRRACGRSRSPSLASSYCGFEPQSFLPASILENRAAAHFRENVREPDQMHWLRRLVTDANNSGKRVWIVVAPVRSDFKKMLPDGNVLFSKLNSLTIINGGILNYYNDSRFNDADMGDTDHLNEIGAKKLTQIILSERS